MRTWATGEGKAWAQRPRGAGAGVSQQGRGRAWRSPPQPWSLSKPDSRSWGCWRGRGSPRAVGRGGFCASLTLAQGSLDSPMGPQATPKKRCGKKGRSGEGESEPKSQACFLPYSARPGVASERHRMDRPRHLGAPPGPQPADCHKQRESSALYAQPALEAASAHR